MSRVSPCLPFISLCFTLIACGGPTQESPKTSSGVSPQPDTPLDAVKRLKVYDSSGEEHACAPPESTCGQPAPERAFADKCALAGYRMMQCGCSSLCTGNVNSTEQKYYDAEGNPHICEPEKSDCTPEPAKASFQDACNDKGFQLKVCGCTWMCSNNFMQ